MHPEVERVARSLHPALCDARLEIDDPQVGGANLGQPITPYIAGIFHDWPPPIGKSSGFRVLFLRKVGPLQTTGMGSNEHDLRILILNAYYEDWR